MFYSFLETFQNGLLQGLHLHHSFKSPRQTHLCKKLSAFQQDQRLDPPQTHSELRSRRTLQSTLLELAFSQDYVTVHLTAVLWRTVFYISYLFSQEVMLNHTASLLSSFNLFCSLFLIQYSCLCSAVMSLNSFPLLKNRKQKDEERKREHTENDILTICTSGVLLKSMFTGSWKSNIFFLLFQQPHILCYYHCCHFTPQDLDRSGDSLDNISLETHWHEFVSYLKCTHHSVR